MSESCNSGRHEGERGGRRMAQEDRNASRRQKTGAVGGTGAGWVGCWAALCVGGGPGD